MRKLLLLVCVAGLFAACKPSKKDLLTRKWQAVTVESPTLDKQVAEQRAFIDTVGKTTDGNTNEQLYGVRNMDSMRGILNQQLDSIIYMQRQSVKGTWMEFRKDGTVAADFGSGVDTVSWRLEDDGSLMLDEMKKKGAGSKIRMEIMELTKDTLQLRFNENGFSSTATFIPDKQ